MWKVALPQSHLESLHVEPVAGQNGDMVAPDNIRRRSAAAGLRNVDHIIVNQRGGMDHLHHSRETTGAIGGGPDQSDCRAAAGRGGDVCRRLPAGID